MRIISMEMGGDAKGVFGCLARGIKAVGDSVKAEGGKDFALAEQHVLIHSCPTMLPKETMEDIAEKEVHPFLCFTNYSLLGWNLI